MIDFKFGFDDEDRVGIYPSKAATACAAGKVVAVTSDGLAAANVSTLYGNYILEQDITTDGPSYMERMLRLYQKDIKAGDYASVMIPKKGGIIWTDQVAEGDGAVAVDIKMILTNGVWTTDQDAASPVAYIRKLPATTGTAGVYELQLV